MIRSEDIQLFRDLAVLVNEVSREQKLTKLKTHGDYWMLIIGNTIGGVKMEQCFKNLSKFVTKFQTEDTLEALRVKFQDAELLSYRFMTKKVSERIAEYHEAYLLKFLELLDNGNTSPSEMGKTGGSSKSEAKSTASRANGKLGGRPKKAKEE